MRWPAVLLLVLAGCADIGQREAVHRSPYGDPDDPSSRNTIPNNRPNPSPYGDPDDRSSYKVGAPYVIAGRRYRPEERFEFTETGVASWYGPNFHRRRTANGETYDMNAMTAARTLQMPCVVHVTNLENGRSAILRINDRGPFASNRVLDLSREAATVLGMRRQGTARVRIDLLPGPSRKVADMAARGRGVRAQRDFVASLAAGRGTVVPVAYYGVQAGAFRDRDRAETVARRLKRRFGTNWRVEATKTLPVLYRVLSPPIHGRRAANALRDRVNVGRNDQAFVVALGN